MIIMARQISVSEDLYETLVEMKGQRSFSETIWKAISGEKKRKELRSFAGALKKDKKKLEELKSTIAKEREANRGRNFSW